MRRLPRLAHIQTENSDRVKRAEAAKFRSFKKYNCGDLVFVCRGLPSGAWRRRRRRWHGRGRMLCHEPASSGHRP
eukprot:8697540-Pyramimonas_sp.AAC.1